MGGVLRGGAALLTSPPPPSMAPSINTTAPIRCGSGPANCRKEFWSSGEEGARNPSPVPPPKILSGVTGGWRRRREGGGGVT